MKDKNIFSRGVEIVCSALIENNKGAILLGKSPKWNNKWVFPGGHIEPGEKIKEAVVREAKEEVGIDVEPQDWFNSGELINSKDFYRPAHFLYFDIWCKTIGENIKIDNREISEYIWVDPQKALDMDLAESYDKVIKEYIIFKKNDWLSQRTN